MSRGVSARAGYGDVTGRDGAHGSWEVWRLGWRGSGSNTGPEISRRHGIVRDWQVLPRPALLPRKIEAWKRDNDLLKFK